MNGPLLSRLMKPYVLTSMKVCADWEKDKVLHSQCRLADSIKEAYNRANFECCIPMNENR